MSPKTIGIIGFDGVTASHLTGAADTFAVAALEDGFGGRIPCYHVWTIGLTARAFAAESGTIFQPHKTLANAPSLNTIIVAGGSGAQEISQALAEWILGRALATARIASVGAGIFALAPTGLLNGREVTTHWRCTRDLERWHPTLRVDHKRLTCTNESPSMRWRNEHVFARAILAACSNKFSTAPRLISWKNFA